MLEPLLDRAQRFVICSTGKRTVMDRRKLRGSVAEVAGRCRLRHQARIIKIQDGKERVYDLRYGAAPILLPGRSEELWVVVVAGFGDEPLDAADQPGNPSRELTVALVDRANLADPLKNSGNFPVHQRATT